ncbi:Heavy-metal-associated domain-containing protein [Tenacibaculum sp. MAR_2009_124]|uniref:heavy-metal-associated domain-containing protein n=1 Tax=Tenacibaculum sp. MAR_2009_124 TaxID=1250059 RepID=UPI0008973CD0|nr:cation transporter [Tenacibaculum sp. MAR_2009_124]SEB67634.1 Heavy-metal-associated domain-containing protein [Tenacibaculum sp. MAR_2009_124]
MKKIVLIVLLMIAGTSVSAQKKKKNAKAVVKVDGVCMMCKKRIEKAALSTKGVKYAVWNVNTHDLSLIFDERKTDLKSIKAVVADVGHDTKDVKASKEAYDNLHPCCKYRDEEVRDDHKKKG